jgi:predicted nucleic acid-binding protein
VSGIDFFVDTNILIYTLTGHPRVSDLLKYSFLYGVSEISEIELLGKKNIPPDEVNIIRNLLNDCVIIDMNKTIKEITIFLKQKYSIKTPDAIIAATAKSFNLPLITADRDFEKIKDVDIVLLD